MTQNYIKTVVKLPNNNESNLFTYVPVAGYTAPGIAAFNENQFNIDNNTHIVTLNPDFMNQYYTKIQVNNLISESDQRTDGLIDHLSNEIQSELQGKVDKVNSYQRIYGTDSNGNQETFSWSTSSSSSSYAFPKRVEGRLPGILDPVNDEDAANKRYIETRLSTKIDKVTQGSGIRVPTTQPDGSQWFLRVTSEADGGTVVMRNNNNNNAKFGEPTEPSHAATKNYVDASIAEQISSVLKPAGSVTFAQLLQVVPSASTLGNLYNVEDAFTTTSAFIEGAGLSHPAGTDVCIIERNGQYYYDVYAGQVDLSNYYTKNETTNLINTEFNKVPVEYGSSDGSMQYKSSLAGCKAWFWRAYNTSTRMLYLSATQPSFADVAVGPSATYSESGDFGIQVGDRIAIVNDIRIDFVTVTVVNGNAIMLDKQVFMQANEDDRSFRYIVVDYDRPDIGVFDYSNGATAFGYNTKAVQFGAFSFGVSSGAYGAYSTAGGRSSEAGFCAVAIGNTNKAYGTYSTAFGSETTAKGSCAFTAGSGSTAKGPYAVSIGRFTAADKQSSQAFGIETHAWADFSTAFGYSTSATGKAQFVIGKWNKETDNTHSNADTNELFIIGNGTSNARSNALVVTNLGSIVLHDGTIGQSIYSAIVAGSGNTVNASNSIIAGRQGTINSADSILVGRTNDDGVTAEINANNSAAFGMGVKVLSGHRSSTVTGFGTKSSNPYCLIGGLYNAGISNNLFEIGNGNKTTGSNAFAVSRTGTARLGADPVNAMDATTKQYVDTAISRINLSNYVQKTDYANVNDAGIVKVNPAYGLVMGVNGTAMINPTNSIELKAGTNTRHPVVPNVLHQSVFYGLSRAAGVNLASSTEETAPDGTNPGVYPEAAKTAIQGLLGITDLIGDINTVLDSVNGVVI